MNWKTVAFISIFAFIFIDSFFFNIPVGPLRITLLRVGIIGLLYVLAIRAFLGLDRFSLARIKFPLLFFGFWFLYGVLSIAWTENKATGIKELYYFSIFLLLIMVLVYFLHGRLQNSWISISFWLFGLGLIVVCCLEFVLNIHLPTSRFVIEGERWADFTDRRATAFFYNENDLSVFFVLAFPFFLTGLLNRSFFYKFVSLGAIVAILAINYLNDARISVMANLLQGLFFLLLVWKKETLKKVGRLLLLFSPVILLGVAGALYYFLQHDQAIYAKLTQGHSAYIRIHLYMNALYASFQSFMLGVGPGNFPYFIYPMFDTLGIVNPHNWWFEILTNYGLLVFAGYVAFFIFLLVRLFSLYRSDKRDKLVALGLLLGFIGFIPACLAPSSLFYFWPMWLYYGVALGYMNQERN